MRKMSGGREKLQLHTMNRIEFSWAWKRIIKGLLVHFHSPSVSFWDPHRLQTGSPASPHPVFWGPHPAKHLKVLGEKMKQEGVETMAENNQMHRPGQEAERCQLMILFPSYTELAARNPEQSKGKEKEQPPGNQLTNSNQRRRAIVSSLTQPSLLLETMNAIDSRC
ncbi:uncharacterized protein LOC119869321 isoform X8 [Canis lupus familiaris]|uniref:uncharacterized protein LOC119869321 isoform X8 n=1 Tax=Canis lupus familiaris TaxID=9615 RepID=UPI0018F64C2E|nr:uncharacterized protein LOC119869321 isoform X8 [Canis lupus familiaris]